MCYTLRVFSVPRIPLLSLSPPAVLLAPSCAGALCVYRCHLVLLQRYSVSVPTFNLYVPSVDGVPRAAVRSCGASTQVPRLSQPTCRSVTACQRKRGGIGTRYVPTLEKPLPRSLPKQSDLAHVPFLATAAKCPAVCERVSAARAPGLRLRPDARATPKPLRPTLAQRRDADPPTPLAPSGSNPGNTRSPCLLTWYIRSRPVW
jgi:hypothetical protein